MSILPLRCCEEESFHTRVRPFPPGQTTTYNVYWRCPKCGQLSGDMGSLAPRDEKARQAIGALPADPLAASREAFEQGLVRRSLALLEMALEATPNAPALYAERGRQLFHASFPDAAAKDLARAVELGDSTPATRGYLGLALSDTPRRLEALPLLEAAVQGDPGGGIWWHGLVRLLVRLERYDQAEAELQRLSVLALDAHWRGGLLTEKANVLCARRRPQEALAAADEAVRLAPGNPYSHFVRGRALGMSGRLDEADAEMDRILAMAPGDPDATSAKAAFAAARRRGKR
jgi:tetratricopeptide (TPR) repeat protein